MEHEQTTSTRTPISIEAHCLTLPGRELHLPSLLTAKKFRNRGNKEAALASFRKLEDDGLGTLVGENPVYSAYCCLFFFVSCLLSAYVFMNYTHDLQSVKLYSLSICTCVNTLCSITGLLK